MKDKSERENLLIFISSFIWSAKEIKKFNKNLAKANEVSKNFGVSIEELQKAVEYLTK